MLRDGFCVVQNRLRKLVRSSGVPWLLHKILQTENKGK